MIREPNLSCPKCFELYTDPAAAVEPMCFSGQCPIEELATDLEVNQAISQYMTAKALFSYTEDPEILRRMHKSLKLYEEPHEHIQIEEIYRKWSDKQAQEQGKTSGYSGRASKKLKKVLS